MPQFEQVDTFISQIFWLLLCFTLLHLFVSRFFVPRIRTIQSRRQSHIEGCLERSRKLLDKAERLEREAEAELATAQEQIAKDTEQALAEVNQFKNEQVDALRAELLQQWEGFQSQLQAEIEKEHQAIEALADSLAVSICEKLLEEKR